MLNNPLLIAHNANYDCRFLLQYLTNERPLVKGGRILSCTAIDYRFGDKKQSINIIIRQFKND